MYHGGVEDNFLPSPGTLEKFKSWSHSGATVIMGTHSHVPQPVVNINDTLMCFGLGNFIVDPREWGDGDWAGTSSVSVTFNTDNPGSSYFENYFKSELDNFGGISTIQSPLPQATFLKREMATEILLDPVMHQAVWQEQAVHLYGSYARKHLLIGAVLDSLRLSKFGRASDKVKNFPLLFDVLGWSVHHEVILTATGLRYGLIEDLRSSESNYFWNSLKRAN